MTLSAIATRYADALADVVTGAGAEVRPHDALAELQAFEAIFRSSADLRYALSSPAVPASRKKAVVARLGQALGFSRITRNFLFVLIDHRRIGGLAEIVEVFEEKLDQRLGFVGAQVVSARSLTETQNKALNAVLERLTGKRIHMRLAVDESLVGGVVARIGSTVYDGSVRGQLRSLERRLTAEGAS